MEITRISTLQPLLKLHSISFLNYPSHILSTAWGLHKRIIIYSLRLLSDKDILAELGQENVLVVDLWDFVKIRVYMRVVRDEPKIPALFHACLGIALN